MAQADASWGVFMVEIRRGFIDVGAGQIHYRRAGAARPGRRALVMLHSNPVSSRSLESLMTRLAMDRLVVAPDTPGLGDSTPLPMAAPEIPDFARPVAAAIDGLGLGAVDLYGSHTGANMALELALQMPDRVGRLILDGIALYSPEERADLLENYAAEMKPDLSGAYLLQAWHFMRDQSVFWPWFHRTADHLRQVGLPSARGLHADVLDVLKALETYHLAYRASFAYDKEGRLPKLTVPTLIATSRTDIFHSTQDRATALVPNGLKLDLPSTAEPGYLDAAARAFAAFLDRA
jgi:pimeloyl-ACP methyl ester carboxylesterase